MAEKIFFQEGKKVLRAKRFFFFLMVCQFIVAFVWRGQRSSYAAQAWDCFCAYVGTKILPDNCTDEDTIRKEVDGSLKRLQVDSIDVFHVRFWIIRPYWWARALRYFALNQTFNFPQSCEAPRCFFFFFLSVVDTVTKERKRFCFGYSDEHSCSECPRIVNKCIHTKQIVKSALKNDCESFCGHEKCKVTSAMVVPA